MRRVNVFDQVSLDGYFVDGDGDMSWAHKSDAEWDAFVSGNASSGGTMLFGRITYEQMASFWPTRAALDMFPVVAKEMNDRPKIVFSRTLKKASWSNTKLVKGDLASEVRTMKSQPGDDLTILGSGSIVSQLAKEGLIDEYKIVINPIVLGKGRTLFEGVTGQLPLKLTKTRAFANGSVLLCYEML
jgi:dihydrofolate reductase